MIIVTCSISKTFHPMYMFIILVLVLYVILSLLAENDIIDYRDIVMTHDNYIVT